MAKMPARTVLALRLKELRQAMGVSQAELGVRMGLPEDVASTRVNRYEKGVHAPDIETAEALAASLGVPLPYLLAADERLAALILAFSKLPAADQKEVLGAAEKMLARRTADMQAEELDRRTAKIPKAAKRRVP